MANFQKEDTEIRDRVRRIETRLTVLAHALGVHVGAASILWNTHDERVQVSTPNCSLGEILRVIPEHFRESDIDVYLGTEYVATVFADVHQRTRAGVAAAEQRGSHVGH